MLDLNIAFANALLNRLDTEFPAGSVLELRTGAPPGADNAAAGVLLCSIVTPAGPWAAAANGAKDIAGVWSGNGTAAAGAGGQNVGHFRFKSADGTKIEEGTVTVTGGGGDATIDTLNISTGKTVNVTSFQHTA